MPNQYVVKDSGERHTFGGGMVRDVADDKVDYSLAYEGPMFHRYAVHLTKAKAKYPDVRPGVSNWLLANSYDEYVRFWKSWLRHTEQKRQCDTTEDHAAAIIFNLNGMEYTKERMIREGTWKGEPSVEWLQPQRLEDVPDGTAVLVADPTNATRETLVQPIQPVAYVGKSSFVPRWSCDYPIP